MADDIEASRSLEDGSMTVTTPIGEVTIEIFQDYDAADEYLTGDTDWEDLSDMDRFRILLEEAETGLDLYERDKL